MRIPSQDKSAPTPLGGPNARTEAEKKNKCTNIPTTSHFASVPQENSQQHLRGTDLYESRFPGIAETKIWAESEEV